MFSELVVLGIRTGTIYRVGLPDGQVTPLYKDAGVSPDGVVVADGIVYWTTMGMPSRDPSVPGEAGLDYSARNGGLHAVSYDGTNARDIVPNGTLTTGKQLAYNGFLYWGDREGCRITRVRPDGTGLTDLIVNEPDDSGMQECVGVTVDATQLYWTQKARPRAASAEFSVPGWRFRRGDRPRPVRRRDPVGAPARADRPGNPRRVPVLDRPGRGSEGQHAEPRAAPWPGRKGRGAGDPGERLHRGHRPGGGRRGRLRIRPWRTDHCGAVGWWPTAGSGRNG